MLDSLVRVSRRVEENHFVIIANPATDTSTAVLTFCTDRPLVSHALGQTDREVSYAEACGFSFLSQNQCRTQRWAADNAEYSTIHAFSNDSNWWWLSQTQVTAAVKRPRMSPGITGFLPLPVNNFKYYLTLFSKFFSSFPHGTCSLSVSRRYLALDELYHPFCAALPSNTTLGTPLVRTEIQLINGILTLYDTLFQGTYS